MADKIYRGTGHRKTSVAKVILRPGKGKITVTEQFSLPIEEIKEAKLKLKF